MSRRQSGEQVIWSAVTPVAITSSTDATPIVVTATAHGLVTGDLVMINGHTTNVAANGLRKITKLTADTYSLQNYNTGANIAGSGAGAGASGVMSVAPKILLVTDWRNVIFSVETSGSFNGTIKIAGSLGDPVTTAAGKYSEDTPNFGGTQSASNQYSFLQIINLDTAAAVNGATGVTSAGTDLHNTYEINVNAVKYITWVFTAWSAGAVTIKAIMTDNL